MNKLILYLKRAAPTILTVAASGGIVASVVFAVRDTPKAMRLLDEAEREKGRKLTKAEAVVTAAPVYIPTVVTGASAIACVVGANILNKRQQAALAGAYALIGNSYKKYRNKVREIYGEEAHRRIIEELSVETCEDRNIEAPTFVTSASLDFRDENEETHIFHDVFSDRYFETTVSKVLQAEYHLNRNFTMGANVSLNDFYDFLGLKRTDFGDAVGWSMETGLSWIDFDHRKTTLKDGTVCYAIIMVFEPDTGFADW